MQTPSPIRVIPVLDLLDGIVVHGVAGRRETYRPIESRLVSSADPLAVACAFRERLGLDRLYIADLDGILSRRPNVDVYRQLAGEGFALMIDAGVQEADDAGAAFDAGAEAVVAGLETLTGPDALERLCRRHGPERVIFSLDLKEGQPLGDAARWGRADPPGIAERAMACGVRRMIVLDLARVGTEGGVGALETVLSIKSRRPAVEVLAGGGVRTGADLESLASAGVDGVLVATALHRETIRRETLFAIAMRGG